MLASWRFRFQISENASFCSWQTVSEALLQGFALNHESFAWAATATLNTLLGLVFWGALAGTMGFVVLSYLHSQLFRRKWSIINS